MTTPSGDKNNDAREAFRELRKARQARPQRTASKQERARREEDRAVVEAASDRTLEGIVKGLAEVQLGFDGSVRALMDTLSREVATLRDTRWAIEVEARRAEALRHVKIAADALDLLKQEHAQAAEALDEEHRTRREALEQEIAEQQAAWAKEDAAFEQEKEDAVGAAREEALANAREEAEAEAALVEGEEAARRRSYEARIDLLEADVERQSEQIDQLTSQLQAALRQTQTLAARAMGRDADRNSDAARAE